MIYPREIGIWQIEPQPTPKNGHYYARHKQCQGLRSIIELLPNKEQFDSHADFYTALNPKIDPASHLLTPFDTHEDHNKGIYALIFPHYQNISLRQQVTHHGPLSLAQALTVTKKIVIALYDLHICDYAHGALSHESIFTNSGDYTRIGDLTKHLKDPSIRQNPTTHDDVYEVGTLLYYMLTGIFPTAPHRIFRKDVHPSVRRLIEKTKRNNIKKRPRVTDIARTIEEIEQELQI